MARTDHLSRTAEVLGTAVMILAVVLGVLTILEIFPMQPPAQAAVVDGHVIFVEELEQTYSQLPDEYKQQYSKQQVLDQLIEKHLILQEAQRLGISVTDEQVDSTVDEQIARMGISEKLLKDALAQTGITLDEYRQAVRDELVLHAFVEQEVLSEHNESEAAQAFSDIIAELRADANIVIY